MKLIKNLIVVGRMLSGGPGTVRASDLAEKIEAATNAALLSIEGDVHSVHVVPEWATASNAGRALILITYEAAEKVVKALKAKLTQGTEESEPAAGSDDATKAAGKNGGKK
jgi:hypothetical protein